MIQATLPILSVDFCGGDKTVLSPRWWYAENTVNHASKFYYVTRGEIVIKTAKESVVAKEGDLLLIPAGTKHSFRLGEGGIGEKYWFHFSLLAGEENAFAGLSCPLCLRGPQEGDMEGRFMRILSLAGEKGLGAGIALSSEILSLVAYFLERAGYEIAHREEDPIERALRMAKKGEAPLTLVEMAKSAYSLDKYLR